eukprot:3711258-Prymnesium_polylepis.1
MEATSGGGYPACVIERHQRKRGSDTPRSVRSEESKGAACNTQMKNMAPTAALTIHEGSQDLPPKYEYAAQLVAADAAGSGTDWRCTLSIGWKWHVFVLAAPLSFVREWLVSHTYEIRWLRASGTRCTDVTLRCEGLPDSMYSGDRATEIGYFDNR